MDRSGQFIHHPAYEGKNIKNYTEEGSLDEIDEILKGSENSHITYNWLNPWDKKAKKKMAIYSYIDELDWIIVSTGYFDDFYAPLLPIKLNIFYIIIFLVLANFVFFHYLHTIFDKPILDIINKLKNINPKEGYDYIEIESSDEIGLIAATFNNLISEIENYEINLENMVDRKTKELRIANEYLYHMTIYDKLTEVHNRSYIMELLTKKFNSKNKFTCILFDIDHFKKVNDTYGHLAGDFILKELCSLISVTKDSSMELARYGGEEFIMCWDSNSEDSYEEIEKIRLAIEEYDFIYNGITKIKITCSFGIASTYDFDPMSIEELIDYSDAALYQSKNTGRNKVTVFSSKSDIK
jgi:diguanylate cyclase (GGDEF)-like protein